ncbi:MAG: hypothetical protein KBF21_10350 [Thermoanaerobaculia bacterium]|nr:hypothetical protein [Thermoanaerobaculia bacterium]
MSREERFVFVVCGAAEQIESLHVALRHLRRFAESPIFVVTDARRNALPIDHDRVIDCPTPAALSEAQAAIWLKTSLHRILEPRHSYCYLDTDVLAARPGVDQVFMYRCGPVTFATDHCRMRYFSPWAVECGCLSVRRLAQAEALNALIEPLDACPPELAEKRRRLEAKLAAYSGRYVAVEPELVERRDAVVRLLERTAGHPWRRKAALLAFVWPRYGARLARRLWRGADAAQAARAVIDDALGTLPEYIRRETGFDWRLDERRGYDEAGRLLLTDVPFYVAAQSEFRFDEARGEWVDGEGERVFHGPCDHLREAIAEDFGVVITEPDWQHWNGGVFLFEAGADSPAAPFLDSWHELTLASFELPRWKTRDQGTLIAAAWKHGLEDQATLPKEFNFLADYHKPGLHFDADRGFSFDGRAGFVRPYLVHVYHHWGDRDWAVWRWLESQIQNPLETPEPAP